MGKQQSQCVSVIWTKINKKTKEHSFGQHYNAQPTHERTNNTTCAHGRQTHTKVICESHEHKQHRINYGKPQSQQTHLPSGGEPTANSLSLLLAMLKLAPLFCGVRPGGEGRACEDRGERAAGAERGGERGEARVGEESAPMCCPFVCVLPFEFTARSKGKPGDGIAPGASECACVVCLLVDFLVFAVCSGTMLCSSSCCTH